MATAGRWSVPLRSTRECAPARRIGCATNRRSRGRPARRRAKALAAAPATEESQGLNPGAPGPPPCVLLPRRQSRSAVKGRTTKLPTPPARAQPAAVEKGKDQPARLAGRRGQSVWRDQRLPGGRYSPATLEALSMIALNSAPVQALDVLMCEIVPVDAAAISEAIMASDSLVSEMSKKSASPVVT